MDTAIQQTHSAQKILKYTYGLVPIVAGLDKFSNLLTRWEDFISAPIANILPFSGDFYGNSGNN